MNGIPASFLVFLVLGDGDRLSVLLLPSSCLHAQSWYNSSWQYREPITISHTKVSGSPTNFPVL